MHTRAKLCKMCGGKFFPASLPFHLKECAKKYAMVELPCPICDRLFTRDEMSAHLPKCELRKMRSGAALASTVGARVQAKARGEAGAGGGPVVPQPVAPEMVMAQPDEDGLVPCAVCGRTFAADRVGKHQAVCRNSQRRRRPTFDATHQRMPDEALSVLRRSNPGGAKRRGRTSLAKSVDSNSTSLSKFRLSEGADKGGIGVLPRAGGRGGVGGGGSTARRTADPSRCAQCGLAPCSGLQPRCHDPPPPDPGRRRPALRPSTYGGSGVGGRSAGGAGYHHRPMTTASAAAPPPSRGAPAWGARRGAGRPPPTQSNAQFLYNAPRRGADGWGGRQAPRGAPSSRGGPGGAMWGRGMGGGGMGGWGGGMGGGGMGGVGGGFGGGGGGGKINILNTNESSLSGSGLLWG